MTILLYILLTIFWGLCAFGSIILYKWQFKEITVSITILSIVLAPIGLMAGIINYLIEKK